MSKIFRCAGHIPLWNGQTRSPVLVPLRRENGIWGVKFVRKHNILPEGEVFKRMSIRNLVLGMIAVCAPASAVTTYNFTTTGDTDISALSLAGITSITAWYATDRVTALASTTGTKFGGAGIGICSANETNCGSGEHQIDNFGRYEFLLFKFSAPVNLASITLTNYANPQGSSDRDFDYYTSSAASLTLGTINNLASLFSVATSVGCTSTSTATCAASGSASTLTGTNVTYLLVGAATGALGTVDGTSDYFKISALSVNTATPEPSTIQTGLLALVGLGFYGLRRRSARKA